MGDRVTALLEAVSDQTVGPAALLHLQLDAATERLEQQRELIPLLDRRADDAGIDTIESPEKLVPLLFAHTAYKSYPESFLLKGRWDRMSAWLDTVSAHSVASIDVRGVDDVDGWIARLADAGIHLIASSGTTGKSSFLPLDDDDLSFLAARPFMNPGERLPLTFLGPSNAPMRTAHSFRALAAACGRPGAVRSLEEPLLVADMLRAAAIRKQMMDETALPSEIAAFESSGAAAAARRQAQLDALIDDVLEQRGAPQVIIGGWATFWRLLERSRSLGIPDGPFHPDTHISISGGRKGLDLPSDYEAQMTAFLGNVRRASAYGMSELTRPAALCAEGVYHWPQSILLLIVDEAGEQLLEPAADGSVTGRLAAYDPAWSGIWGGVISGDRVTAHFRPCRCGAPGPTIAPDIVRYSELSAAGDDKLTCGGTIDAYIRGVVGG